MKPSTHLRIDRRLCGSAVSLEAGTATVELVTTSEMEVDDRKLVHGGFVFGLADHAAMLAINHPTVVLGMAHVRFLKPVVVGDRLVARADVRDQLGKKANVHVEVARGEDVVMVGELTCIIPSTHVLDR